MTEDERVGQHHRINGHEFEQTLGDSEGQGSLTFCSPWGRKESDTAQQLNNNSRNTTINIIISYGRYIDYVFPLKQSKYTFSVSIYSIHISCFPDSITWIIGISTLVWVKSKVTFLSVSPKFDLMSSLSSLAFTFGTSCIEGHKLGNEVQETEGGSKDQYYGRGYQAQKYCFFSCTSAVTTHTSQQQDQCMVITAMFFE